jgi:glycosyltransferase involved in cell wall biosynthesis
LLAGFRSDRIHCVPLGRDALPEPARPWTGAASLLFVGSLVRGKGVDMLLRSMAKSLPALRQSLGDTLTLDVVGAGPEATSLRRLAGRLGIEGCTRWHGRLAGVQLGARYAAATAVVMPSRIPETFGLVGLEAMAAGRPVVATPFGGCDAWLEDGVTGVRARGTDAASLAAALLALVADPELPARLGAAARERHRAHFTEGAFAARLEATIETLAWRGKDRRAGVPV